MKTYKHKTLWWIAEIEDFNKPLCKYKTLDSDWIVIHRCFISSDSNREEVVEKDWIERFADEVNYQFDWDMEDFRKILEKHAPKQKKFTDEYVWDFVRRHSNPENEVCVRWTLEIFLNENNLLSSDD